MKCEERVFFNRIKGLMKLICIKIFCLLIFFIPALAYGSHWVNPKIVVRDPMLARLQHERTELTVLEKKK